MNQSFECSRCHKDITGVEMTADLLLVCKECRNKKNGNRETIRTFAGGATRDTDSGKPSYVKALSPVVLRRYVEYIGKHRLQSDGHLRDWDNWKQGMPQDVYLDGLGRHLVSVWLLAQGFPAFDNHGAVTLEDSICGIMFNAQGILHEILKEKEERKKV